MTIKIGSNIYSLRAQRRLEENSSELRTTLERLASGQRINKASDDPAGLAVSKNLDVKNRVAGKALLNLNEGVGILNIADGALEQLTDITTRIRELAAQGSNGGLSASQRRAINNEAQALDREFTRIVQATEYNESKLFNGKFGDLRIQTGFGSSGNIGTALGGNVGTGAFGSSLVLGSVTNQDKILATDVNKDGIVDLVSSGDSGSDIMVMLGTGTGTFGSALNVDNVSAMDISTEDVNGDGKTDILTADTYQGLGVYLGNGDGTFSAGNWFISLGYYSSLAAGDFNNDGRIDAALGSVDGNYDIFLGNGNGSFTFKGAVTAGGSTELKTADFNNDGKLDLAGAEADGVTVYLGDGKGGFGAGSIISSSSAVDIAVGDLNGDGRPDIAAVSAESPDMTVHLGNGNGTFATQLAYVMAESGTSVAIGDFDGSGRADIVVTPTTSSSTLLFLNQGNGKYGAATNISFAKQQTEIAVSDFNRDGVLDLATTSSGSGLAVVTGRTTSGVASLVPFSLLSQEESRQAVGHLDRAITNLSNTRGSIGSLMSRYEMASRTIMSQKAEGMAADSRIRDADYAQDVSKLVRNQIGQQTATAVLAQANQAPALALTLLRG